MVASDTVYEAKSSLLLTNERWQWFLNLPLCMKKFAPSFSHHVKGRTWHLLARVFMVWWDDVRWCKCGSVYACEQWTMCRGPLISVSLWRCALVHPASPDWNQNIGASASTEGEGDWGQHGEKALLLNEPFVAVSPALSLFSDSQRWHWRQPGTQEKLHTSLTCRPSQSPLQRFFAIF